MQMHDDNDLVIQGVFCCISSKEAASYLEQGAFMLLLCRKIMINEKDILRSSTGFQQPFFDGPNGS
jgi:hypothetical protein